MIKCLSANRPPGAIGDKETEILPLHWSPSSPSTMRWRPPFSLSLCSSFPSSLLQLVTSYNRSINRNRIYCRDVNQEE